MNILKKVIPKKIYTNLTETYSKIVPFCVVKLLPNNIAPAKLRYKFILELAKENNIRNFIETGTYLGDTINSVKKYFDKIYSIEISKELVALAKKRFEKDKNINIIQGDSGEQLTYLLDNINEKTIFWLDGHYSDQFLFSDINQKGINESPIEKEIKTIFESKIKNLDNIILIDDAHEFDGTRGYPTIEEFKKLIEKQTSNYNVYKKYNIIFILPKNINY